MEFINYGFVDDVRNGPWILEKEFFACSRKPRGASRRYILRTKALQTTCWINIYYDYFQRVFVFLLFSLIKQQRRRKTIFKKFFMENGKL
jgi:hypothetical protein